MSYKQYSGFDPLVRPVQTPVIRKSVCREKLEYRAPGRPFYRCGQLFEVNDDACVDVSCRSRLVKSSAESIDSYVAVVALVEDVVDTNVGPERPTFAYKLMANPKIRNGVTGHRDGVRGIWCILRYNLFN